MITRIRCDAPITDAQRSACRREKLARAGLWLSILMMGFAAADVRGQTPPAAGSITNPAPPTGDDFRRNLQLPYRAALRSSQLDRTAKELIGKVLHYQVWLLAAPGLESDRQKNIRTIVNDLRSGNTSAVAREFMLSQIILRCEQLLNEPAADVRVIAVHLLAQCKTSYNPDVPAVETLDPLLKTLAFPDKYIHVKVVAAPAIGVILRDAPANRLPVLKRIDAAEKLAAEIKRLRDVRGTPQAPQTIGRNWAMWNLIDALGHSDRLYNQARQPVFGDVLLETMVDPQEDLLTRCRAAHALTRLPFEATTNIGLVNYQTAKLAHELGSAYNESLAAKTIWPMWRRCALHLYCAFETENASVERPQMHGLMYQVNRSGLAAAKGKIQEARGLVLPVINTLSGTVLKPPPVPAAALDALSAWLTANQPEANAKLTPESRPLPAAPRPAGQREAGATPPAPSTN